MSRCARGDTFALGDFKFEKLEKKSISLYRENTGYEKERINRIFIIIIHQICYMNRNVFSKTAAAIICLCKKKLVGNFD